MQTSERSSFFARTLRRKPAAAAAPLPEAVVPSLLSGAAAGGAAAAPEAVSALFVVYDADGTPAGELIYMTKKLLGLGHCAACDITHGPRREKPEFTQLKAAGWGVPLVNIHRDEMDAALAAAVGPRLPCVAARTAARDVVLLGQDALATCNGDVLRFQKMVDAALAAHRLTAPPAPPQACAMRAPPQKPPPQKPAPPAEKRERFGARIGLRRERDAVVPISRN